MGGDGEEEEDGDQLRPRREEEAAGGEHEGGEGEVRDGVDLASVRGPEDSSPTSPGRDEIPKQLPIPVLISLKTKFAFLEKLMSLGDLSSVVVDNIICNMIIEL